MKILLHVPMLVVAALATGPALAGEEPFDGDVIVVTGTASDGGNVLCIADGCATIMESLLREKMFDRLLSLSDPMAYLEEPDSSLAVDREEFCKRLEDTRPAGCSASSPPSVPGFDVGWQPNGCGLGGWRDAALTLVARVALNDFTGDLDAPYPGVSFRSACDRHDRCYGSQRGRLFCDGEFNLGMYTACGNSTFGDAYTVCSSMASAYFLAVTHYGEPAYAQAGADRACATWHAEMTINGCSES